MYLFRLAGTQAGRKENAIGPSAAPNGLVARATGPRFLPQRCRPPRCSPACLSACLRRLSPPFRAPTDATWPKGEGRRRGEGGSESEGGLHKKLTRRLFCPSTPASRCTGGILRDSVETSPASPATSSTNKTACAAQTLFCYHEDHHM